jgi:hypothetical protein
MLRSQKKICWNFPNCRARRLQNISNGPEHHVFAELLVKDTIFQLVNKIILKNQFGEQWHSAIQFFMF